MNTCPACGKQFGGYYSFAPWCSAAHWALADNNKWERELAELSAATEAAWAAMESRRGTDRSVIHQIHEESGA